MGGREPFEPGSMNDPVAIQTEWTPCKGGGANFCTHKLVEDTPERLHFRPTLGAILFGLVFLGVGALMGTILIRAIFSGAGSIGTELLFLFMGVVFGGLGAYLLWSGTRPIVFDQKLGLYWKGWGDATSGSIDPTKNLVPLERIHALQIISEHCSGNETSFWSYELNLVLDDGTRINVIDHGDLERVRIDARILATRLEIPLWDPA